MFVFCGGMQRSGSTLQFQLTAHLVEAAGKGRRMDWASPDQLPAVLKKNERSRDLFVVKTHVFTDAIAAQFEKGRAMGVYCYRDIRDVVVSIIHKESKPFDPVWVSDRVDNNLRWFELWTRQPRTLVTRYETMTADLAGEVERIAAHVGVTMDRAQAEKIAAQYSKDKQLETIEQAKRENRIKNVQWAQFDSHSLLHVNHIRSGEIDTWKTELTPDQVQFIESRAGGWLTAHGYTLSTQQTGE